MQNHVRKVLSCYVKCQEVQSVFSNPATTVVIGLNLKKDLKKKHCGRDIGKNVMKFDLSF